MRPEVHDWPLPRATMSRFPWPSRWTFLVELVIVSISPVPNTPRPVLYRQNLGFALRPAGPLKLSHHTRTHCLLLRAALPWLGVEADRVSEAYVTSDTTTSPITSQNLFRHAVPPIPSHPSPLMPAVGAGLTLTADVHEATTHPCALTGLSLPAQASRWSAARSSSSQSPLTGLKCIKDLGQ